MKKVTNYDMRGEGFKNQDFLGDVIFEWSPGVELKTEWYDGYLLWQ